VGFLKKSMVFVNIDRGDLRALDEATKSIQSSSTNQLAPDLAREFAGNTSKTVVSTSVLTPSKSSTETKLRLRKTVFSVGLITLATIKPWRSRKRLAIPLKDWLTKVDPEIAKALHDDTRVTKDDVTNNEANDIKNSTQTKPKVNNRCAKH